MSDQRNPEEHEEAPAFVPPYDVTPDEASRPHSATPTDREPVDSQRRLRIIVFSILVVGFLAFIGMGTVTARSVWYDLEGETTNQEDPGRKNPQPQYSDASVIDVWSEMFRDVPGGEDTGNRLAFALVLVVTLAAGVSLCWLAMVPSEPAWRSDLDRPKTPQRSA